MVIRFPQEFHVCRPCALENVMYMLPGLDCQRGRVAVYMNCPGIPVPIHLMEETQVEYLSPGSGAQGPLSDVSVIFPTENGGVIVIRIKVRALAVLSAPSKNNPISS